MFKSFCADNQVQVQHLNGDQDQDIPMQILNVNGQGQAQNPAQNLDAIESDSNSDENPEAVA